MNRLTAGVQGNGGIARYGRNDILTSTVSGNEGGEKICSLGIRLLNEKRGQV